MSTCRSPACCKFCRPCTTSPQPTAVAMAHILISKRQPTGISAQLIWDTPWLLGFFVFLIYIISYYILYIYIISIYMFGRKTVERKSLSIFFAQFYCLQRSLSLRLSTTWAIRTWHHGCKRPGDARRCQAMPAVKGIFESVSLVEFQCCVRDFRFCG